MKKNNTKRALVLSVLSLLMCCSMLVGSTFAWFTDSVTSRNNVITSGNLDVELEYSTDGTTWAPVTEDVALFNETSLWEPGHTQIVALKVKNVGSLALKYALSTTIYLEEEGTNVLGQQFKLSDYLELSAVSMDGGPIGDALISHYFKTRDASGLTATQFGADIATGSVLFPEGYGYCVVRIAMPTTVGNEANHKTGTKAPRISFGVELLATQAPHESDSFGPDYDANAEYLKAPVANVTPLDVTDITATLGMGGAAQPFTLDKAFRFKTSESKAQAQQSDYRYWHADFVVKADKDVPADSMALAGYYAAYCDDYNNGNWVALVNDGTDIVAGTELRLLELMLNGGSMNYEELCEWVPTFDCGVSDLTDANAGTTITVELRLYEVTQNGASTSVETGEYVTVGRYTHTF